jgi:hypothetical protein
MKTGTRLTNVKYAGNIIAAMIYKKSPGISGFLEKPAFNLVCKGDSKIYEFVQENCFA